MLGETEGVSRDVGKLDDLIALVVMAEDQQLIAECLFGCLGSCHEGWVRSHRQLTRTVDAALARGVSLTPEQQQRQGSRRDPLWQVQILHSHVFDANTGKIPFVRVLIAPDCFGDTLSAPDAAKTIASSWTTHDELVCIPMSDGGPGFLDVLAGLGSFTQVEVTDPWGTPTIARVLLDDHRAFIETAESVGTQLARGRELDPYASSSSLGQVLAFALTLEVTEMIVGLGGTASSDGGRGAAEFVTTWPSQVSLVGCTDVSVPLLGPTGAAHGFGRQKGASPEQVVELESAMLARADQLAEMAGVDVRDVPGAGAAGGLGAWILALGGRLESGVDRVAAVTGLDAAIAAADLVVTGEGRFDAGSLRGKVVGAIARRAAAAAKPCIVIAGSVEAGRREAAAHGVDESFSCAELAGGVAESMAEPERWLEDATKLAARAWSSSRT